VVGLAGAAASPFSWSHHWVWFVPLLVYLGHRGYVAGSRSGMTIMWLLWLVTAGWLFTFHGRAPRSGLVGWRPGGEWNVLLPSAYVFVFVAIAAALVFWLWPIRSPVFAVRRSDRAAPDRRVPIHAPPQRAPRVGGRRSSSPAAAASEPVSARRTPAVPGFAP
jgi:alpha-1,2-mannosyltransferase